MTAVDCLAGIMQIFASTYLDGTLLILLGQAAIPISMVISKLLLDEQYRLRGTYMSHIDPTQGKSKDWDDMSLPRSRYKLPQYIGAGVVALGITVVLGPRLGGGGESDGSAGGGAE